MFFVGLGVFLSGAARDIDADSGLAWLCLGMGILTWVLGLALIALFLIALARRKCLAALFATVAPLPAGAVLIAGPTNGADFWGGVPTPPVAAFAVGIVLAAATAVALKIRVPAEGADTPGWQHGVARLPSAIAAMVVAVGGLVLTMSVLWMGLVGSEAWVHESPWGIVAWVPVLAGVWFLVYRLWRRSGRPRTGSRHTPG
jgi:hypothetical protein